MMTLLPSFLSKVGCLRQVCCRYRYVPKILSVSLDCFDHGATPASCSLTPGPKRWDPGREGKWRHVLQAGAGGRTKKKKGVKGMEGKSKGRGEGVRQPGKTDGEE